MRLHCTSRSCVRHRLPIAVVIGGLVNVGVAAACYRMAVLSGPGVTEVDWAGPRNVEPRTSGWIVHSIGAISFVTGWCKNIHWDDGTITPGVSDAIATPRPVPPPCPYAALVGAVSPPPELIAAPSGMIVVIGEACGWPALAFSKELESSGLSMSTSTPTPWRPFVQGFVINTITYTAIVLGLWTLGPAAWLRWTRRRRGACIRCGYQLHSLLRCPECGLLIS